MGKRFGRNQKRRMRGQIQAAEADAARWKRRHDEVSALGWRNQQIVEETAQVLGRYFITLDPDIIEVRHVDQIANGWRVPVVQEVPFRSVDPRDCPIDEAQFLERVLPVLSGSIVQHDLRSERHVRFTYAGRVVGYAISEGALLMMRHEDRVRRVAEEMARHLAGSLHVGAPQ